MGLSLLAGEVLSPEEYARELVEAIKWWEQRRPRNYNANRVVFEALLNHANEIGEEASRFFKLYPRRTTFTVALFSNLNAVWSRSEIMVSIYRNPVPGIGRRSLVMRGYKLDNLWTTQSQVAKRVLEPLGVTLW